MLLVRWRIDKFILSNGLLNASGISQILLKGFFVKKFEPVIHHLITNNYFVYVKKDEVKHAVNGAVYVMNAAAEAKVRRVVLTSSIGAVHMDPNRSPNKVVDETCWSDLDFCKNTKVCN